MTYGCIWAQVGDLRHLLLRIASTFATLLLTSGFSHIWRWVNDLMEWLLFVTVEMMKGYRSMKMTRDNNKVVCEGCGLWMEESMQSPEEEKSGMLTPPLHTSASVPFRWEQEPGKPIPFLLTHSDLLPKCLKLPPRLLIPSPTTLFHRSPSFTNTTNCYSSHTLMPTPRTIKDYGCFPSWKKKLKIGLTPVTHKDIHMPNMKRSGTSSTLLFHPNSCAWTSICEGIKQVVPWRCKKRKKDEIGL
ncbi:hypothetical protein VNO77_18673 [Canavalia gladiata]|uniref:Uncharacterized protein n=1 Tax=Canavalia gladiata TaxID=3824 RepID=A0AAN9QHW0_CANGL